MVTPWPWPSAVVSAYGTRHKSECSPVRAGSDHPVTGRTTPQITHQNRTPARGTCHGEHTQQQPECQLLAITQKAMVRIKWEKRQMIGAMELLDDVVALRMPRGSFCRDLRRTMLQAGIEADQVVDPAAKAEFELGVPVIRITDDWLLQILRGHLDSNWHGDREHLDQQADSDE